ncbi:hypothetical protein K435DRAFT_878532 [Dendrothele bispora CBS 962.96]|uniref:Uncharacterized protein n=1 Tax=Dendrothele bispora (strain CBS 962.96) TaxID=1314807 RepID=A0A4S8KN29_DENBC|nr:hypothetical protein K435DRAFT_878532 [Dendrothele bispora CBS 962.96]
MEEIREVGSATLTVVKEVARKAVEENFYRREPWIDLFVSDNELAISDVWDSYLPSGSRYGRRQDLNSGATASVGYSTSVTVTATKIWDDPTYYYIVLEEKDRQWRDYQMMPVLVIGTGNRDWMRSSYHYI